MFVSKTLTVENTGGYIYNIGNSITGPSYELSEYPFSTIEEFDPPSVEQISTFNCRNDGYFDWVIHYFFVEVSIPYTGVDLEISSASLNFIIDDEHVEDEIICEYGWSEDEPVDRTEVIAQLNSITNFTHRQQFSTLQNVTTPVQEAWNAGHETFYLLIKTTNLRPTFTDFYRFTDVTVELNYQLWPKNTYALPEGSYLIDDLREHDCFTIDNMSVTFEDTLVAVDEPTIQSQATDIITIDESFQFDSYVLSDIIDDEDDFNTSTPAAIFRSRVIPFDTYYREMIEATLEDVDTLTDSFSHGQREGSTEDIEVWLDEFTTSFRSEAFVDNETLIDGFTFTIQRSSGDQDDIDEDDTFSYSIQRERPFEDVISELEGFSDETVIGVPA